MEKKLQFAAESTVKNKSAIAGVAYSGGTIGQSWSGIPVVVDLASLQMAPQIALMYNHYYSPEYRLGIVKCVNDGRQIVFDGEIDTAKELGAGIAEEGKRYQWQASIGADMPGDVLEIKDGSKASVNGREFDGPLTIVRGAVLREVSVVALGADAQTHIQIAAGFTTTGGNTMIEEKNNQVTAQADAKPDIESAVKAALAKRDADEKRRIDGIEAAFGSDFPELKLQAVTKGWSIEAANQELIKALRESKPVVPNVMVRGQHSTSGETLKAAAMISAGVTVDDVVKTVGEPAVEAAAKTYRSQVGPKRLLLELAAANGFNDRMIDESNWMSAADHAIKASFSNVSLSGILADVYNKRLMQGFMSADQSWREIAAISSVSDFKQINSYRLNMTGGFDKVGPGGELKHGQLSDESFSNKAETYGKMLGLTRQDIINDDLGALSSIPFMFGRAAANSFNRVFWTEFLDNASFFTGSSINSSGAALSVSGLDSAEQGFYAITAADGEVTGIKPAILLVPIGLKNLAKQLFNDTVLGVTSLGATNAKAKDPISNPFAGQFRPVASPYLSDATISGYSPIDYYLLADPMDCPVIQAVFLGGRQTPIVESSQAEFNTLGIQYRAYMDFGAKKQDPKGGYKMDVTA